MAKGLTTFARPHFGYRLARSLVRLRLSFRSIRLLGGGRLNASGRSVMAINSTAGLDQALLLTAAFDRPIQWLLQESAIKNWRDRYSARLLRAILIGDELDAWMPRVEDILDALRRGKAVALFPRTRVDEGNPFGQAARLGAELGRRSEDPVELAVFPVDVLVPSNPSAKDETLIYLDNPIYPREHLHRAEGDPIQATCSLTAALDEARQLNAFRLLPHQLADLRDDLEDMLRSQLREDWANRPGWRQQATDFKLSRFVEEWIEQTNSRDPSRVLALGQLLERCRRARRRWAEERFEVETAGAWIELPLSQLATLAESAIGLPVAIYGLLNHLLPGVMIGGVGRWMKSKPVNTPAEWANRGVALVAGYAVEVLLCDHFLGRAAAGYYALTLPLSGAYLWRYTLLWRRRTRRVLLKLRLAMRAGRLRRMRQNLVERLDLEFGAGVEMPSVPY